MNEQIEVNRKPWEAELDGLYKKLKETEEKLKKWGASKAPTSRRTQNKKRNCD